jgi:hypothetical protein
MLGPVIDRNCKSANSPDGGGGSVVGSEDMTPMAVTPHTHPRVLSRNSMRLFPDWDSPGSSAKIVSGLVERVVNSRKDGRRGAATPEAGVR